MNGVTWSCGTNRASVPNRKTIKKKFTWTCAKTPSFISHSPLLLSEISDTVSYFHYIISALGVEISKWSNYPQWTFILQWWRPVIRLEKWSIPGCDAHQRGNSLQQFEGMQCFHLHGPATFQMITAYLSLGSRSLLGLHDPGCDGNAMFHKYLELLSQQQSFTSQKNLKFHTPKFLVHWFSENANIFTPIT